ncbi:hypothetical protein F3Y22_tig00116971pilonHSYRG00198 [Hibiscus syriacus]|uniref:RNase H type-1 domain-containing protein n=1 Tax=Hibiscus syriacus TaxID=106335 RepID=A0A6A2X8D1_HIBSY|nr:hypothetical protein F3Y22_tig00116971pilonHSYRG00198 [Hibiscus syriacus]
MVAWFPPLSGFLKLNTDGASQGNPGVAGADGLLRNEAADWILGFTAHLGICTSVAAELYAIRTGLSLAWNSLHPLGTIIEDVRSLKARNWIIKFQHTYREGNFCVDVLSKMACTIDEELMVFYSPLTEISSFLDADSR